MKHSSMNIAEALASIDLNHRPSVYLWNYPEEVARKYGFNLSEITSDESQQIRRFKARAYLAALLYLSGKPPVAHTTFGCVVREIDGRSMRVVQYDEGNFSCIDTAQQLVAYLQRLRDKIPDEPGSFWSEGGTRCCTGESARRQLDRPTTPVKTLPR